MGLCPQPDPLPRAAGAGAQGPRPVDTACLRPDMEAAGATRRARGSETRLYGPGSSFPRLEVLDQVPRNKLLTLREALLRLL